MLDVAAVPLAAGYAIGRIGCQLAGDGDYGIPWDGPWAMAYPNGTVPTTEEVHPTPVYETITMLLVAALLWRWRHRWRPGTLFALYLILAGAERFLVEFVRRNDDVLLGLTQPQLFSIVMIGRRRRSGSGSCAAARRPQRPPGRARSALTNPYAARALYPEDSSVDGGLLTIGGCDARELAREFGTPAYVVAEDDLRARARAFTGALAERHAGRGRDRVRLEGVPVHRGAACVRRGGPGLRRRVRR